jgi:hypothetical protein
VKIMFVEKRIAEMAYLILIMAVMYFFIDSAAKKRYVPKIRRLAAMDAIEEAAGRCAEMGRPFFTDIGYAGRMTDLGFRESLAGMSVMTYTAKQCAEKDVRMIVGAAAPEAIPMLEGVVMEQYMLAGNPEMFDQNVFRYTASFGMGYPMQMCGLLLEFRPASFLTIGKMASSTVIYGETANKLGSFIIGGTASVGNITFVVGCYDYMLIGEEIFAA